MITKPTPFKLSAWWHNARTPCYGFVLVPYVFKSTLVFSNPWVTAKVNNYLVKWRFNYWRAIWPQFCNYPCGKERRAQRCSEEVAEDRQRGSSVCGSSYHFEHHYGRTLLQRLWEGLKSCLWRGQMPLSLLHAPLLNRHHPECNQ